MTLITDYVTAAIAGLVRQAECLRSLKSPQLNLPQGELKELFIGGFLKKFLPGYLNVGSGVIVNMKGTQSGQTDIIIYDSRVLPPFIQEQHLGVYPVESVIGTIEAKTVLEDTGLENARQAAETLNTIFKEQRSQRGFEEMFAPLADPVCAVFGFDVKGLEDLSRADGGEDYLKAFPRNLFIVCVAGKFCWARVGEARLWTPGVGQTDPISHEYDYAETARFIALFVDNARTVAERRCMPLHGKRYHRDWLSLYIRKHE